MNDITSIARRTSTAAPLFAEAKALGVTIAVLADDSTAVVQMSHPGYGNAAHPLEFTFTWVADGQPEMESADVYETFADLDAAVTWALQTEIDNISMLLG